LLGRATGSPEWPQATSRLVLVSFCDCRAP
jgi:hypothetical protein